MPESLASANVVWWTANGTSSDSAPSSGGLTGPPGGASPTAPIATRSISRPGPTLKNPSGNDIRLAIAPIRSKKTCSRNCTSTIAMLSFSVRFHQSAEAAPRGLA